MGTTAQIVGKGRWRSQVGAAERIRAEFVTIPMGHDNRFPWVKSGLARPGFRGRIKAHVNDFLLRRDIAEIVPSDVDVVLVIGQDDGVCAHSTEGQTLGQSTWSFNIGDWSIVDLLDCVGRQTTRYTVPFTSTLHLQFGIVNFVVDILLKAIIAPVHPNDVGITLKVNG